MPPDRFDSRVPSSAVPQTKREARQRQRQIARLAEQRAGFEDVDEQQDVTFEGGEFVPDEQAVDEAEKSLAAETAADREFVQIGDIDVGINQDTLDVETLGLSEEGRQNAQQRQAEQLRQEAASQSNRFGESDFVVDRSGDEIAVEATESAVDRERREQAAQQFEADSRFLTSVDPSEISLSSDQARLSDAALSRAKQRAEAAEQRQRSKAIGKQKREFAAKLRSGTATDGVALSGATAADVVVEDGKLKPDQQLRNQLDQQATQQQKQQVASDLSAGDGLDIPQSDIPQTDPSDIVVDDGKLRPNQQTQNQITRAAFAEDLESGEAFPTSVDNPEAVLSNVDPSDITIDSDGDPKPSESIQSQIDSVVQSRSTQEAKQDFAAGLEAGEPFIDEGTDGELTTTPEEARSILQDVDASDIEQTDDGSLTPDDEIQAQIAEFQIREQVDDSVSLPSVDEQTVVDQQDELGEQIAREFAARNPNVEFAQELTRETLPDNVATQQAEAVVTPNFVDFADGQQGTEFEVGRIAVGGEFLRSGAGIENFDTFVRDPGGEIDTRQYQAIDGNVGDVVGGDATFDATELLADENKATAADILDRRLPQADITADDVTRSGGQFTVSDSVRDQFGIEDNQITADGLTESGQDDLARRQLQDIQSAEAVSVDTPIGSKPFANVSGALAQAARGQGSLSSATRIVAASDTVNNIGDLDDMADTQIIAGLDPEEAADRFGLIDESQVRSAQQDIQQRQQQLESDPGAVLESIADNQDEFVNDATRIGVAGERGQRIRSAARSQLNDLEADIAAADPEVDPRDVDISLTDDLSGIRSINREGRQAVAQRVDDQLANFDSSEIEVGVSGGQITTSIEDSVRERFVQNAQRIDEIQARNEIADETEGIDRRDIKVDAGEGVSPTDQLVTETLGSDVDADIESFDQLQQAAQTQTRFEARQQAIDQVESQTIGAVDPQNVTVERTEQGFEANVSGAAAQTTNLSAVDAAAPATDPIDLGTGQQGSDEPLVQAGEDLPDSIGEVPSAVAGGGEFVDVNAPTRPPEIRRAVSDTTQDAIGVDIDRNIGRQTLQDVRSTGRDIVTGDFNAPDGSPVAGAAGIAVAAPEPVSTGTGAAVLGGLALGGAITSIANNQAEIDVPDRTPASGFSEIDIGQTRQEIGEIDVPDRTPATDFGEVDIPDRATIGGEIDVPDRTPATDTGEVDIPSIDAAQLIGRGDLVEEEEEDETVLGEEDIPANPFEPIQERGGTPERFIREDRDAFVIRTPETPEINQEQAQEPTVDEAITTGVGSGFGTGTGVGGGTQPIVSVGGDVDTQPGVGSGTEPIAPVGSGVDTLSGVDVGVGPETGSGVDTATGVRSDTQTDADTQFDTPTRQQTTTQNTFVEPNFTETTPGFESGFQRQPNRTGRSRRRPRRPNVAVDSDANSGEDGGKQGLDSEIVEFDFLTLDETDDRIEDVLGGG